jgi:DnaJ-domain-containing protein 1
VRTNWREIRDEAEWRDMLNLTGLTPEQLRAQGFFFREAEAELHRPHCRGSRHHRTLGIRPGATREEIRSAYRSLAMQHHPDHGGSVEKMREINLAYATIVGRLRVTLGPLCETVHRGRLESCPIEQSPFAE